MSRKAVVIMNALESIEDNSKNIEWTEQEPFIYEKTDAILC